ncbi:MAG: adenine phosphoribosyltransferase [Clostridia bacterium]|nr:adenine phosphoribosyltransferase [Clostridia bacterium]
MKEYYPIEVAGVKRDLKLFPVSDTLSIAAFILFGDVELTVACAKALADIAPEHDVLVTAEAKSIPLIHELAKQLGENEYVVARKGPKVYMEDIVTVKVNSITTQKEQTLCIGKKEAELMRGKRVLIIDDVISTGESLKALEKLVEAVDGNIVGKLAVLAEGDAINREDITVLAPLPLFDSNGEPLE